MTLQEFQEKLARSETIEYKGHVDNDTRFGWYVRVLQGLVFQTLFVGLDRVNGVLIVEDVS
jgi:hypothetical protein